MLASKKCFLISQGLVGSGMNCRALKSAGFLLFVYISIALGDPIIKRTRVGIILTVPHFVACSKPGHQFPMSCCGFFCVQMFEVRSSCLFCWYLWNCWQSPIKLSFHNAYHLYLKKNHSKISRESTNLHYNIVVYYIIH